MIDIAAIQAHLSLLLSLGSPGVWMISSYGEDPATGATLFPKVHPITDLELAVATVAAWSMEPHRNVYVSAATLAVQPKPGDRGFESDIAFVPYLVADFDDLDAANWPHRVPFMPSWVLETSPGRFQAAFAFDRAVPPEQAKQIARGLKAFCRCDHGTGDIAHVWRIPGTINWPNVKKATAGRVPAPVRVVQPWNGLRVAPEIVASYLPQDVAPPPNVAMLLTDGPRPEWSGPTDDDELFAAMLSAKHSAAVAFGARCPVERLFPGDPSVLVEFFNGDESALDAAVFQHLAFWTGCDQKRMDRMARRTIWVRDKWDNRQDYLPRTIQKACGQQQNVYCRPQPVPTVPPPPVSNPNEWNHRNDLIELVPDEDTAPLGRGIPIQGDMYARFFEGVVHVHEREGVVWSQRHGRFLTQRGFQAVYGRRHFAIAPETSLKIEKPTDNAWEALYRNQFYQVPVADNIAFRPEVKPGALIFEEGHRLLNTWVPIEVEKVPGDVQMFLDHTAKLFPDANDRAQIIAYMAAVAQYPGVKFQWAPLIQGMEGNGKTFLGSCLSHAVGLRYTHVPNASDISNKFNAWIDRKLFIVVEEIYVADRRETLDALKPLITNERIEIQGKNANQVTGDNRANFMLFSNHKDAWPKTKRDRRVSCFFTAQQTMDDLKTWGMTGDYFPRLWNWAKFGGGYAAINHFLHTYAIPDELNPATRMHRAPDTSSTEEAINESLSPCAREIADAVDMLLGFKGGFVSSIMAKQHLEMKHLRVPRNMDTMMSELGYVRHPALKDRGRTNNVVRPDGARPYLYVKENGPLMGITDAAEVANRYEAAQI